MDAGCYVAPIGVVLGSLLCQNVLAAAGDTFQPYISYTYSYDDNLLRQPTGQVINANTADTYRRTEGGLMVDKSIGRQHVTANFNFSRTNFHQYTKLDNDAKDFQASWNWQLGNHLQGNLGASYTQSLTPYTEFHSAERNLRTQRREFFDAAWRVHPSWSLHAGFSQYKLGYDLITQKFGDRTEETGELGVDYLAPSNSTVGMLVRHIRGGFPTLQQIGSLAVDNSYIQNECKGKVDWVFSGKSRLQFLGGWVERKHDFFPARDASGPSVRMIANWLPTGKVELVMNLWRDIYASDDLTASYTLNKGISLAPKWDISSKVRMEGLYKYERRDFTGATAFTTLLPSNRQDASSYVSLALSYSALKNLQVSASVFRDTLHTSIPQSDYRAKGMMISLRSVF